MSDLRYALRLLQRSPTATVAAVITLALGIGVTTAIVTVVYAVLFRPLPVAADRMLVAIFRTSPSLQRWRDPISGVRFDEWRARSTGFASMAAISRKPIDLMFAGTAERVEAELVSGNFFDVLGVSAVHGRVFAEEDARASDAIPCVISEVVTSFVRLQRIAPGFDTRSLLTVRISLPERRYPTSDADNGAHRVEASAVQVRRLACQPASRRYACESA